MKDIPPELKNAPMLFGLEAQGHIPTINRMLKAGASWEEIGRAIGWCPKTTEEHYGWYLEKKEEVTK